MVYKLTLAYAPVFILFQILFYLFIRYLFIVLDIYLTISLYTLDTLHGSHYYNTT